MKFLASLEKGKTLYNAVHIFLIRDLVVPCHILCANAREIDAGVIVYQKLSSS